MRTANPALNDKAFSTRHNLRTDETMTLQGTVNKCFFLVGLVILTAVITWGQIFPNGVEQGLSTVLPPWFYTAFFGGIIGALVLSLVIIFKKQTSPYLAPIYAILEGVLMGTVSALFELKYPGIVFQAVLGTAAVFVSLLLVYKSGLIKVTDNFRMGVVAATGGIALIYVISMVMSFFGTSIPMIHEGGVVGIGFSLFVIGIAALNLVLDFDFIEKASGQSSPKYMEWYAAFGLLITLIWLYLEILRLLGKSRR